MGNKNMISCLTKYLLIFYLLTTFMVDLYKPRYNIYTYSPSNILHDENKNVSIKGAYNYQVPIYDTQN